MIYWTGLLIVVGLIIAWRGLILTDPNRVQSLLDRWKESNNGAIR